MTKKSKIKEKISNKSKKNLPEKAKMQNGIKFTIMAVVLIAIFCVALTPVTLQNDTFYTIKIGEHIMQNGIDMQDPFSWHQDLAYTYPHWLYDVITYLIYNTFGMTGIYITTCILSVILGLTLFFTNKKLLKNQSISFIITIGVMYLIRGYIAARAQLVTFILFVLTIYFIERFLETKKKRYAVGLIIIPTLIANLHTAVFPFYFILYLPYIAEYIIAILAETIIYRKFAVAKLKFKIKIATNKNEDPEKIKQLREELKKLEEKIDKIKVKRTKELQNPYKIKLVKRDNCKWLILIMVICIFTGLLTPLGNTPYTYLQKTMQGNTTQNINEHLPMTLANDTEVVCTLVILLAILIFTKTKIRLCDLFMIGGLGYLMLMTKRQVTMFTLMGSFILNRLMLELIQTETKKDLKELTIQFNNLVTVPVMVVVTAVMLGLSYHMAEDKFDDQYVDESAYPVQACDYILENIDLGKAKFYNEYNYGSYMIFRGIPVFIDSRADLYAPEFSGKDEDIFMDFINTSNIGTFYEDTFEKYGITHVITYSDSSLNKKLKSDSDYKKIYPTTLEQKMQDDRFVIYEKIEKDESVEE